MSQAVAEHHFVLGQFVRNRAHCVSDALVGGRQEANQRDEQHGSVESLGPVVLREDTSLVEGIGEHILADFVSGQSPPRGQ